MLSKILSLAALAFCFALPSHAETTLSFYGGYQTAPHSKVTGTYADSSPMRFTTGWEGKSFDTPPYYGLRATWWKTQNLGFALEVNHAKVYADAEGKQNGGFSRLEFTDGLNLVTVNALYRWQNETRRFTPYVGFGAGVAIPHVDITPISTGVHTFGYQVTGPALQWVGGVSYDLNDRWALFGEYKGSFSWNKVKLDDGGRLNTNVVTNALNIGITYKF